METPFVGNAPHCKAEDSTGISRANTFGELCEIAQKIICRMPKPVIMVCGKIATGGGTPGENGARIGRAILLLRYRGANVFSQLPFQGRMLAIINTPYYQGPDHLLEEFYLPLFKKHIQELRFLHDWRDSFGAQWEHDRGTELRMPIEVLPEGFELQPLPVLAGQ